MKTKYLLVGLLTILSLNNNLYCQNEDDDLGIISLSTTVDWADPIYASLFDDSRNTETVKSRSPITEFKQTDSRWGSNHYGASTCKSNIATNGCALTCMAMILASSGLNVTPATLQTFMQNSTDPILFSGCAVFFQAVNYFPGNTGTSAKIRFPDGRFILNDHYNILKSIIKSNGYAIAKVKLCHHFVLVYDYINEGTQPSDFLVADPGASGSHTLADYVLCDVNYNILPFSATKVDFKAEKTTVGPSERIKFIMGGSLEIRSAIYNRVWVVKNSSGNVVYTNTTDNDPQFSLPIGNYSVSLVVHDSDGYGSIVKNGYITVTPVIYTDPTETCFDGERNQDETGIDCGGICAPCGMGGNLNSIVDYISCGCSDWGINIPRIAANATFSIVNSNLNIFFYEKLIGNPAYLQTTRIFRLSHGTLKQDIVRGSQSALYKCNGIPYNYAIYTTLNGGVFFEQPNFHFSPTKEYEVQFKYWSNTNPVTFKLTNGLVEDFEGLTESPYGDELWKSKITTPPVPATVFNIGYISEVSKYCSGDHYNNNIDYQYDVYKIRFRPDAVYSQLWITGSNIKIAEIKLFEHCLDNISYTENSQTIFPITTAKEQITILNRNINADEQYQFVSGKSIVFHNTTITATAAGSFRAYIDNNVCPESSQPQPSQEVTDNSSSIINDEYGKDIANSICIYPNPTNGMFMVEIENADIQINSIDIINMSGNTIKKITNLLQSEIDLSRLHKGTYLLKIVTNLGTVYKKIVFI